MVGRGAAKKSSATYLSASRPGLRISLASLTRMSSCFSTSLRVLPHSSTPAILSKTRLRMRLWTKRIDRGKVRHQVPPPGLPGISGEKGPTKHPQYLPDDGLDPFPDAVGGPPGHRLHLGLVGAGPATYAHLPARKPGNVPATPRHVVGLVEEARLSPIRVVGAPLVEKAGGALPVQVPRLVLVGGFRWVAPQHPAPLLAHPGVEVVVGGVVVARGGVGEGARLGRERIGRVGAGREGARLGRERIGRVGAGREGARLGRGLGG
jgi:hypothetical protein